MGIGADDDRRRGNGSGGRQRINPTVPMPVVAAMAITTTIVAIDVGVAHIDDSRKGRQVAISADLCGIVLSVCTEQGHARIEAVTGYIIAFKVNSGPRPPRDRE